jgi:hypothetical protein
MHIASSVLGYKPDALKALPKLSARINGPNAAATAAFDAQMAELADQMIDIRKRWGFKLFERQVLQYALAEAMIAVYAQITVLLRASGACTEQEQATALLACARLQDRARLWMDRVRVGDDAARGGWVASILA